MKNEVWCVFQDNVARKLDLQRGTISFQFTNHAFTVSSFTRSCRCFMVVIGRFCETPASAAADALQFLRNLLELVTLDYIAHLVLAEIAQLDSAFQTGTHFFDVILEAPQRGNAAVINRLALS